jgi:hypothetical protein
MKIKNQAVFLVLVLVVSLFSLGGCARPSGKEASMKAEVDAAQDAPTLESPKQRLSYALGMVLGNQFRSQSVEVDLDLYTQGLRDALSGGRTLLTEAEARSVVDRLQREMKRNPPPQEAAVPPGIEFSFKLDSRLTRGMYMGDRWVSPPVFISVQEGKEATVEARANVVGSVEKPMKASPEWMAEDSGMVTVTPARGEEVKITVKREGQSRLKVVSSEVSRELLIQATYHGDTIQVEISQ